MHDEGPSGERETISILLHDDDTNTGLRSPSRGSKQRSKPYPFTWRELNGI